MSARCGLAPALVPTHDSILTTHHSRCQGFDTPCVKARRFVGEIVSENRQACLWPRFRKTYEKMRTSPDGLLVVDPAECKVTIKHLSELPKIMELLHALNDPLAGGKNVGKLVTKIPVLAARVVERALSQSRKKEVYSIDQAINMVGNRGLEGELLTLLEDLTIKKAEAEDPR